MKTLALFFDAELQAANCIFSEQEDNLVLNAHAYNFTVCAVKGDKFLLADRQLLASALAQASGSIVRVFIDKEMTRGFADDGEVGVGRAHEILPLAF